MKKEEHAKRLSKLMKYRQDHINNPTQKELEVELFLVKNKFKYMKQKIFFSQGMSCIVDFYIPKHKCCIEVDGGYHNTKIQKAKDRAKNNYLSKVRNLCVVRIKNKDVPGSFSELKQALKSATRGKVVFI